MLSGRRSVVELVGGSGWQGVGCGPGLATDEHLFESPHHSDFSLLTVLKMRKDCHHSPGHNGVTVTTPLHHC